MAIDKKAFMEAADELREILPIVARQLRAYYNELIEAGFTPSQALRIVIAHGVYPGGLGGEGRGK